jgi:muramidase (phage lysozyme)
MKLMTCVAVIAIGLVGCAAPSSEEDSGDVSSDLSAKGTCSPKRAVGIIPAKQKALLDTIAFTEGTRGRGDDGYNVIVGYQYAQDCTKHPHRYVKSANSTAAGRYQFLSRTWDGLNLPSFEPENQERGAMKLIARRGVVVPTSRAMTATEFANALSRLSYEWASLPPHRYGGQGKLGTTAVRKEYCRLAGCP